LVSFWPSHLPKLLVSAKAPAVAGSVKIYLTRSGRPSKLSPAVIASGVLHRNQIKHSLSSKMKKDNQFYRDMQHYIAVTTIGPSVLRNQGSEGVIKAAQKHLAVINLGIFQAKDKADFLRVLDNQTERLRDTLPWGAQHWGSARKALNLFLRDICYNRFLCELYKLSDSEEWMEIPLDRLIATALKRKGKRGELPRWPGLKRLNSDVSLRFQAFAKQIASEQGISRVHLDMRLWTEEREKNGKPHAPGFGS